MLDSSYLLVFFIFLFFSFLYSSDYFMSCDSLRLKQKGISLSLPLLLSFPIPFVSTLFLFVLFSCDFQLLVMMIRCYPLTSWSFFPVAFLSFPFLSFPFLLILIFGWLGCWYTIVFCHLMLLIPLPSYFLALLLRSWFYWVSSHIVKLSCSNRLVVQLSPAADNEIDK